MKKLLIGVSGYARSGKDTLTGNVIRFLETKGIRARQFSFANYLKQDLRDLCLSKFNIDSFTENTEEKTLIRPILISYGETARNISKGTYWWKLVKSEVDNAFKNNEIDVAIVSDCRFYEYEGQDEIDFIKSYNETSNYPFKVDNLLVTVKQRGCKPAHISEAKNTPKIEAASDNVISWPYFGDDQIERSEKYCEELYANIVRKLDVR